MGIHIPPYRFHANKLSQVGCICQLGPRTPVLCLSDYNGQCVVGEPHSFSLEHRRRWIVRLQHWILCRDPVRHGFQNDFALNHLNPPGFVELCKLLVQISFAYWGKPFNPSEPCSYSCLGNGDFAVVHFGWQDLDLRGQEWKWQRQQVDLQCGGSHVLHHQGSWGHRGEIGWPWHVANAEGSIMGGEKMNVPES